MRFSFEDSLGIDASFSSKQGTVGLHYRSNNCDPVKNRTNLKEKGINFEVVLLGSNDSCVLTLEDLYADETH